ncbi:hypothetical protein EBH_0084430 [Eimeria brunetti]|uniref:Uncharacterized protein n=1 Tax=Eimeria brunetti TaxID=51314 RepID=U6LKS4_9EIME|nr:hypothetical protein EBH_0084430 [Eimeria brunetti]
MLVGSYKGLILLQAFALLWGSSEWDSSIRSSISSSISSSKGSSTGSSKSSSRKEAVSYKGMILVHLFAFFWGIGECYSSIRSSISSSISSSKGSSKGSSKSSSRKEAGCFLQGHDFVAFVCIFLGHRRVLQQHPQQHQQQHQQQQGHQQQQEQQHPQQQEAGCFLQGHDFVAFVCIFLGHRRVLRIRARRSRRSNSTKPPTLDAGGTLHALSLATPI